jgi:hypothetical protein
MTTDADIAETPAEIASAIEYAAKEVSAEVFNRFCGSLRYTYTVGDFTGDVAALTAALGRAPVAAELDRLCLAVDEALDDRLGAMADAHAG